MIGDYIKEITPSTVNSRSVSPCYFFLSVCFVLCCVVHFVLISTSLLYNTRSLQPVPSMVSPLMGSQLQFGMVRMRPCLPECSCARKRTRILTLCLSHTARCNRRGSRDVPPAAHDETAVSCCRSACSAGIVTTHTDI